MEGEVVGGLVEEREVPQDLAARSERPRRVRMRYNMRRSLHPSCIEDRLIQVRSKKPTGPLRTSTPILRLPSFAQGRQLALLLDAPSQKACYFIPPEPPRNMMEHDPIERKQRPPSQTRSTLLLFPHYIHAARSSLVSGWSGRLGLRSPPASSRYWGSTEAVSPLHVVAASGRTRDR